MHAPRSILSPCIVSLSELSKALGRFAALSTLLVVLVSPFASVLTFADNSIV